MGHRLFTYAADLYSFSSNRLGPIQNRLHTCHLEFNSKITILLYIWKKIRVMPYKRCRKLVLCKCYNCMTYRGQRDSYVILVIPQLLRRSCKFVRLFKINSVLKLSIYLFLLCVTWPVCLSLVLLNILTTRGGEYKLRSSFLQNSLCSPLISLLSESNIFPGTSFSRIFSLCYYLNVRH
jgi:hypothetical protein